VNTLQAWTAAVVSELGLAEIPDRDVVLDLARDVAHGVARPAAPLTTYLAGLAVGPGRTPVMWLPASPALRRSGFLRNDRKVSRRRGDTDLEPLIDR